MSDANVTGDCIRVEDLKDLIGELRMMARQLLKGESHNHSFTPTALAMTALRRVKLQEQDWLNVQWANRAHFFSALATAMRHALIDYARRRKAKGRENLIYLPPDEIVFRDLPSDAEERPERILLLEEALSRLESEDQRLANAVHQFYFMGYNTSEMALFSGVSEKTVDRDLKRARIVLRRLMDQPPKASLA